MDTVIAAQRKLIALERIESAALALAPKFDCLAQAEAVRAATHKDDGLKTLFKLEAIADLLEKMAGQGKPTVGFPLPDYSKPVTATNEYADRGASTEAIAVDPETPIRGVPKKAKRK